MINKIINKDNLFNIQTIKPFYFHLFQMFCLILHLLQELILFFFISKKTTNILLNRNFTNKLLVFSDGAKKKTLLEDNNF